MNKYDKALLYLSVHKCNTCVLESQKKAIIEQQKHQLVLKELVEKATPKKAIAHGIRPGREINTVSYTCPVCDKHIGVDNFCKHCGQALDYRSEEE